MIGILHPPEQRVDSQSLSDDEISRLSVECIARLLADRLYTILRHSIETFGSADTPASATSEARHRSNLSNGRDYAMLRRLITHCEPRLTPKQPANGWRRSGTSSAEP